MFKKRTGFLAAALGLGWWLCANATAPAQTWQKPPCASPYPPPCATPYNPIAPPVPPTPVKPGEEPRPDQPRPDQPRPDQPRPDQPQPNMSQFNPGATQGDIGSGGDAPSGSVGLQGRGDANNRFNLFDNMTAIPRNQVWIGWQALDGFNTNVIGSSPSSL